MKPEIRKKFDDALSTLAKEGIHLSIRCEDRNGRHNARVGGAKDSQHLHGTAMDFCILGLTDTQLTRVLQVFCMEEAHGFGIYTRKGVSTGSLHVDFRKGPLKIWGKEGSYHDSGSDWLPEWAKRGLSTPNLPSLHPELPRQENDPLTAILLAILALFIPKHQQADIADLGNLPSPFQNRQSGKNTGFNRSQA